MQSICQISKHRPPASCFNLKSANRIGRIAEMLELPTHLVMLDSEVVFVPLEKAVEVDLSQWKTYAAPDEDGDGLVFLEDL